MGNQRTFQFYYSIGPLECIFIALLALANEEVRTHFLPYGGTNAKAPKHKNIALLTLQIAYSLLLQKLVLYVVVLGYQRTFLPYGGTNEKAPKRKRLVSFIYSIL